jgi:2'-5' RNA ligase
MPRLFTGLEIPPDIAQELSLLRGGVRGASWIEPENYHITLRFIGDIAEGTARELIEALDEVDMSCFTLRLKGIGTFGGAKPRAIWAGVECADDTLRRLQASHERYAQLVGLKPETRRFTPHVTLARLNEVSLPEVEQYALAHSLFETREFDVRRFVVFSSRPSRGGGPYAVEEVYPFRDYEDEYYALSD